MPVNNGDVLRVTARFRMFDEDVQNVFHLQSNNTGSVADATADAAIVTWLDDAYNNLSAEISDELERVDIVIQNLTEGTPARFSMWDTYPTPSDTNTPLPLQVSALVTFPSNTVKSIGRKFVAGFTEADNVDPGVPDSSIISVLSTWATDILSAITLGTGLLEAGNFNYNTSTFAKWLFAQIATFWATQRRRRAGVGS